MKRRSERCRSETTGLAMIVPLSGIAPELDGAFTWIGDISVILLLGVTAVTIFFAVRHPRGRNRKPARLEGNTALEVVWLVIPMILLLCIFHGGHDRSETTREVPGDAMMVEVHAAQHSWSFVYREKGITSDELCVPVNRPVALELHPDENGVVHGFYLPAYGVKEDRASGEDTHPWFRARKEGTHHIFCAECCGRDPGSMESELVVLSEDGFQEWVDRQIALRNRPVEIEVAMNPESEEIKACDAPALYKTHCISCHGPEGRGGLVENARDFTRPEGWKRTPKITDIFRTLSEGIEGTRMRAFVNVRPVDRFALAHHVRSFAQGPGPECSEAEIAALVEEYHIGEEVEPPPTIPVEEAMRLIAKEAERRE